MPMCEAQWTASSGKDTNDEDGVECQTFPKNIEEQPILYVVMETVSKSPPDDKPIKFGPECFFNKAHQLKCIQSEYSLTKYRS